MLGNRTVYLDKARGGVNSWSSIGKEPPFLGQFKEKLLPNLECLGEQTSILWDFRCVRGILLAHFYQFVSS